MDLAAPNAVPIFVLAEMKLWEFEIEDHTDALLALAAVMASPVNQTWLKYKPNFTDKNFPSQMYNWIAFSATFTVANF